jgi:hypothetical protein
MFGNLVILAFALGFFVRPEVGATNLNGDFITGQVGIDNIRAVPEPSAAALLAGCALVVAARRFRRTRRDLVRTTKWFSHVLTLVTEVSKTSKASHPTNRGKNHFKI